MKCLLNIFLFVVTISISITNVSSVKNNIVELTDENWKECLNGEWIIKFYAPWCPACRANEPEFKEFSQWSDELNIKVAMVDITKEPGLSGRFMVTALPTFYHGKDGTFRRYAGDRKAESMQDYIESQIWKTQEPISWLRHPDSIQMAIMSSLFKTSIIMKNIHETLTDTYGFSSWVSYIAFGLGTLLTGLLLGMKRKPEESREKASSAESVSDSQRTSTSLSQKKKTNESEEKKKLAGSESESEKSQDGLSQMSSRASQEWENVNEFEDGDASQVRKRKAKKKINKEAGDSTPSTN